MKFTQKSMAVSSLASFSDTNDANEALKLQKAMPLQGQYLRVKPPSNSDNLIGFMFGFRDPY